MTAETLRRAAACIRVDYGPDADVDGLPDGDPFMLAVADWLESTANDVEHVHDAIYNLTSTTVARALTVARAYLGEST